MNQRQQTFTNPGNGKASDVNGFILDEIAFRTCELLAPGTESRGFGNTIVSKLASVKERFQEKVQTGYEAQGSNLIQGGRQLPLHRHLSKRAAPASQRILA